MKTAYDRLDDATMPEPNTGCWLWIASVNSAGYGQLMVDGRMRTAHSVSYERHVGAVPDGKELDHKWLYKTVLEPRSP